MILIDKHRGELLGDLIARARTEHGVSDAEPITYAGRLDPMAEGLVVLLVGPDEVRRKDDYLGLDKCYSFDVLFGVSTDTHDVLGIIDAVVPIEPPPTSIQEAADTFLGETEQAYPAYSSKPVEGKALFEHARAGRVVDLPTHRVTMDSIRLVGTRHLTGAELAAEGERLVGLVRGDFRQADCIASWQAFGRNAGDQAFIVASFEATVGSGFYVRSLARDMGLRLGTVGLAWCIRRLSVGELTLPEAQNA